VLRAVRRGATFDIALRAALGDLADADRRLAHELAAGVLRARTALDQEIARCVTSAWQRVTEDVRDLLRLGAYQLLELDRVPAHAAVATMVDLARRECGARSAGFVNAVLRRIARERDAGPAPQGAAAREAGNGRAAGELARQYSHPEWLVARWVARFGTARTAALLECNNRRPPMHLQPARWDLDRLAQELAAAGIASESAPGGAGLALRGVRVERLPGFRDGGFVVQDAAQALGLAHAAIPDAALVWDACAAPGGKAATLARRCRVIASDVRRKRLARLQETVRRAAPDVRVLYADAMRPPFGADRFDAVLLDVPCTATGTLAKHPDARWRVSPARLQRLQVLQAALLDGVAGTVRPGGALVYMTCSLEPEENAVQMERFLADHPAFRREREDLVLFPPDSGTDGGYTARLARTA
jgi:16S rRNA (cytosine967-C5)-methyltransferase